MQVRIQYEIPKDLILVLNEDEIAAYHAGLSTDDFDWFADLIHEKVGMHAMSWFEIEDIKEVG
jgi:hypothetical protein